MKGYKIIDPNWKCRGFKYKVGARYIMDGEIEPCIRGFHFCETVDACFNYKPLNPKYHLCEIEALSLCDETGLVAIRHHDKLVSNNIRIIREISWYEWLRSEEGAPYLKLLRQVVANKDYIRKNNVPIPYGTMMCIDDWEGYMFDRDLLIPCEKDIYKKKPMDRSNIVG